MRFMTVKLFALPLFLMAFSLSARAEGGGAEKAEPGAEKAEHGEEKAEHGAAKADAEERRKREYQEKTQRLQFLKGGLATDEKELAELTKKKDEERDPAQQRVLMEEMLKVSKSRDRRVREIQALKSDLELRFPGEGGARSRLYRTGERRKDKREPIESASGLDELLTRTKRLIDRKYAPFNPEQAAELEPAQPEPQQVQALPAENEGAEEAAVGPLTAPLKNPETSKRKRLRLER